jgi:hypothetical protein
MWLLRVTQYNVTDMSGTNCFPYTREIEGLWCNSIEISTSNKTGGLSYDLQLQGQYCEIYNDTSSLFRFEKKNIFLWKTDSPSTALTL